MGKCKKTAKNLVKIEIDNYVSETLLVVAQHGSKDGCRIEETIHRVPAPLDSLPSVFDPCLFKDTQDHTFYDASKLEDEQNGPERISLCSLLGEYSNCSLYS